MKKPYVFNAHIKGGSTIHVVTLHTSNVGPEKLEEHLTKGRVPIDDYTVEKVPGKEGLFNLVKPLSKMLTLGLAGRRCSVIVWTDGSRKFLEEFLKAPIFQTLLVKKNVEISISHQMLDAAHTYFIERYGYSE